MENLFNRKQLEKLAFQAHWDLLNLRPGRYARRQWQKGTSKMNKTELVTYIHELWKLRLEVQGLSHLV